MVDVHTVGAGGGSIGWRDPGGALRVGPRSAGAEPGPACYGRGGSEPTVTDANLLLGRLAADSTPGRRRRPRRRRGRAPRSRALAASLGLDALETAEGIVRVANQEMVRALRVVTVERGIDPRRFALLPFGGAGPMHAAAIAAELGIERDPLPARRRRPLGARPLRLRPPPRHHPHGDARRRGLTAERIAAEVDELVAAAGDGLDGREAGGRLRDALRRPGLRAARRRAIAAPDPADLAERFERAHEERYGHRDPEGEVVLVHIRLAMVAPGPEPAPAARRRDRLESDRAGPLRRRVASRRRSCAASRRRGCEAEGPVVFELPEATFVAAAGLAAPRSTSAGTIRRASVEPDERSEGSTRSPCR